MPLGLLLLDENQVKSGQGNDAHRQKYRTHLDADCNMLPSSSRLS